jgi:hypothetical protein
MRLTRVLVPSVRASPAAGKVAERLGFSPALRASFALRMRPMHAVPEQLSPLVVALPSSHVRALARCSQPTGAGELTSVVQRLPSSQGGRLVLVVVELLVLVLVELLVLVLVELLVLVLVELLVLVLVELLVLVVELLLVDVVEVLVLLVELLLVELLLEVDVEVEVVVVVTQPAMGAYWQPVAGAQLSVVQGFASSQLIGVWVQPLAGAQPSVVHTFASSQLMALPPTHWPARQASAVVQALASSQGVPLATAVCVQTPT